MDDKIASVNRTMNDMGLEMELELFAKAVRIHGNEESS